MSVACLAAVFFAFAGALTLASVDRPRIIRMAHLFFAGGFVWLSACFMEWITHAEVNEMKAYALAFLIGGTIFAAWLGAWRWVQSNHAEAMAQGTSSPTPTPTPAANSKKTGQDVGKQTSQKSKGNNSPNVHQEQKNSGGARLTE